MAENRIKFKRSNVAGKTPLTSDIDSGELSINTTDGKIFFQRDDNTIQSAVTTNSLTTGSVQLKGPFASHLNGQYDLTSSITVTATTKTSNHRYNGQGSSNGYYFNGIESPYITFYPGKSYIFDWSGATSHPVAFYLDAAQNTQYTTGVSTPATYQTQISVTEDTPSILYYMCTQHPYMGNAAHIQSAATSSYAITASHALNAGGSSGKYGISNSSGEYTYYSDLSSSLQAATSGDTIQLFTSVTESADHEYHLKDGVDFNFNGNELFYETTTATGLEIFTDNGTQVTCSFYNGKIRFNQPGNGTNNLIKMTGAGTQINSVGFEWEVMEGTNYAIYLQASNSALDGGKFTANSGYAGVLIRHYYTEIRNVEIITHGASVTYSYGFNDTTSNFPRVKNSTIYGYFDNVENKSLFTQITGLHLIGNFIYLRGKSTGTKSKVSSGGTEFIGNVIDTKNASGIICASSIGNTIFVETGDFGLTVSSEVVGGSIDMLNGQALITANEVTSGVRVTGLSIRCKEFGGAAAELGTNTSLMGCDLFDDYGSADATLVKVKTGCTGVEIANCTFDFMNASGRVGNIGITAADNGTVVKFANNTIMGGTLFNPTKVTQGILNTPDAQGNMSMTF